MKHVADVVLTLREKFGKTQLVKNWLRLNFPVFFSQMQNTTWIVILTPIVFPDFFFKAKTTTSTFWNAFIMVRIKDMNIKEEEYVTSIIELLEFISLKHIEQKILQYLEILPKNTHKL